MLKTVLTTGITLLIILAISVPLHAQTGNGSIQGVVKDASGAVVPGAQVTVTQQETSVTFRTKSNGIGFFVLPSLAIGRYTVLVESAGMEGWQAELTLLAGQTAEVSPALKVGAATQTVTVTGDVAPLVTTTSGTLGNVLERERVEQLPLNGRSFTSLMNMTVPGLEGNNSGNVGFVYGIRYGIEIQMDGALMQDRYVGQTFARPPGLDSINEMQATTNSASAKVNMPGLVTLTTRNGTNQLHGSLFETARNNAVGLARSRTDYYTNPPHLVRNEFGGSVGGPVWIPKIYNGKNKTFFFFNYEARRLMSSSTGQVAVPTPAMRVGDFSGLVDSTGHANTIYDPYSSGPAPNYTRTPFPNQRIPLTQQSALSKFLFSQTPLPTLTNINPLAGYNYYAPYPSTTREYTYTMRFDHHITDRDQVFVRYTHGKQGTTSINDDNNGSPRTLDGYGNFQAAAQSNYTGAISYTHTFSPTFFSETLLNGGYDFIGNLAAGTDNYDQKFGLPDPVGNPGTGWPFVYNVGTSSVNWMDYWGWPASRDVSRLATLDENLIKIKGRHELLFGGRFHEESLDYFGGSQYPAGYYNFASMATAALDPSTGSSYGAQPYTGNNTANLFMGVAGNLASQFWRNDYKLHAGERTLYFQDNIKVNARLTVNAGLRWEFFLPIQVADGGIVGWDQKTMAAVLGTSLNNMVASGYANAAVVSGLQAQGMVFETAQQAGLPASLVHSYWKNFGPRLGVAYRLTGGSHPLILRGGASLYAYPEPERTHLTEYEYCLPQVGLFNFQENNSAQSPDGAPNYSLRKAPDVLVGVNSANVIDINNPSGLVRGTQYFRIPSLDEPTDRAWNWNFTLEKEIGLHTMVSAAYVGTHGYNLGQMVEYNSQPNSYIWYVKTGTPTPTGTYSGVAERPYFTPTGPGSVYGAIEMYQKVGWSNMSGIQFQVQHRFSNGLGFQAYYLLSNAMRAGGNGWSDQLLQNPEYYLNPVPADMHARNQLENYSRDTEFPKHRFNYNWIYNLPLGRGQRFGGKMSRALDLVAGGWQLVGDGTVTSTYFTLPTSNWGGPYSKAQIYGTQYQIMDCRSGTCYRGYLWWNGYIPSTQISSASPSACPKGMVCGLPSNYSPALAPINTDPTSPYYNSNTVFVTLNNGQKVSASYNTGLNPWNNQFARGPWTFGLDGSLWKAFHIREKTSLQFHADFFNVLNMPGIPAPGSDGTISLRTSRYSPRNLQLTLRLVW